MKTLLSIHPGPADTLVFQDIPTPEPGPNQLLIRVHAVSLNYPDALMLEDLYQTKPPRPFAPGGEVAGIVEAVGEGVTRFAVGDRVVAVCGHGGLAELTLCGTALACRLPDDMPFDVGATLMMAYGTTIHALLDRAELTSGETLLVLGASGGLGIAAVELGKALGARVVAGVSSEEKRDAALAAGADDCIVYPRDALDKQASRDLANQFKQAAPEGYNVIYDPVGGDYVEPAIRAIAWEGRYAVIGFTAGIPQLPLNLTLLKCCQVVGVFWGVWASKNNTRLQQEMQMLFDFWREGKIKPLISERFTLASAAGALAKMRDRGAIGKFIVSIEQD